MLCLVMVRTAGMEMRVARRTTRRGGMGNGDRPRLALWRRRGLVSLSLSAGQLALLMMPADKLLCGSNHTIT